jgi:hypothetical protein
MQPQGETAAALPEKAPPRLDGVTIATRWLDALRDGNQPELAAYTVYPFELHDEGGHCAPRQTASNTEQLAAVLRCLSTDAVLIDVLRAHDLGGVEALPSIHLAAWAEKWHVTPTPDLQIVTGAYSRGDAQFTLDLWVVGQGIRAAWKSGVDGSRETKIAVEWLDALRNRDFERLSRATSYPFEVRDTRREARCGKRVAKRPDALAAATDCLFRAELLHRALVDSPTPGFSVYEPSEPLANWIEPWWRENEHRELQRVATMVGTVDGYEFDFQMLIARDGGVRTVWKLGSFESTQ